MLNSRIAVVIPARSDNCDLRILVQSVLDQNPQPEEVIVVNTNSAGRRFVSLEQLLKQHDRLRIMNAPDASPGKGRNMAIAATNAGIIAHIDSGCSLADNWLQGLVSPLLADTADYVTGNVLAQPTPRRLFGIHYDMGPILFASNTWVARSDKNMAGGASVAYRRWIWEKAGGQPEWLRVGEDVLYVRKIKAMGIRHAYAQDSVCFWQPGPRLFDAVRRRYRYVHADMQMHPLPKHATAAILRVLVLAGLVAVSPASPRSLLLPAACAGVWTMRLSLKAQKRYASFVYGRNHRLPSLLSFFVFATSSFLMSAAEIAGVGRGLFKRTRSKEAQVRVNEYLAAA